MYVYERGEHISQRIIPPAGEGVGRPERSRLGARARVGRVLERALQHVAKMKDRMCLMSQLVHSYQLGSVLSKSAGEGVLGPSSLRCGWKGRRGSRVPMRGRHT